ncbi:hypothetical protein FAZ19_05800 [Sphingobacterium alkalisoli]|uniref:DUF4890 domain-containing protein n=1 Tax=Sphingobacterium alkalisoli TaxID=1874115 RepID=A0A4U0H440_9SPHI|nr:hypothetical protein [Sphingobacterium alkalisoli]TJY66435.1 hypothetical protein FAZ19_05800 [Sphingobacterium alkalisoli]GGH16429.1 hypothetical protein GCM10011418_18790 [Sphingobacterium alkalisoli]
MKKKLLIIIFVAFTLAFQSVKLVAQTSPKQSNANVVNRIKADLAISSEKAGKLLDILTSFGESIQANTADSSLSPKQKQNKTISLMKEQNESIQRLLTDDEYRVWVNLGKKRRAANTSRSKTNDQMNKRFPSQMRGAVLDQNQ